MFRTAIVFFAMGAACLIAAFFSPDYVDDQGFLHEPFAWMAIGRLLLIGGALLALTGLGAKVWSRLSD